MNTDFLKSQINSIVSLSSEEWAQFLPFLESKTLKKNGYLLQEGQVCDSIAFVNAGVLIYFKFLENGKEVTTDFAFKSEWVTDKLKEYPDVSQNVPLYHIANYLGIAPKSLSRIRLLTYLQIEYPED